MDVIFLSPGYPTDMPYFVTGLAKVGARVIGVGDQHIDALPAEAKESCWKYIQIRSWADEDEVIRTIHHALGGHQVQLVESLWEVNMVLAARLRESLGLPGMTVGQTVPFRDKGAMKQVLQAAGLRTPYSHRATTIDGCREAAADIGFPIIIKPIDGAGSMDTYRIENEADLEDALSKLGHIPEVSVEEFISGDEFTYDTICANGQIMFENVCEYRPNPLIGKQVEWISPQVITYRDLDQPGIAGGVELGHRVIEAMGFQSGFTHMEWYRKHDGEVVFGEIAARSGGGRIPDLMNYACDTDVYTGWAEAVCYGTFSQPTERKYNVSQVIKRAQGQGRIAHVDGLSQSMAAFGEHIVNVDLVPIGQPRRDWQQTVLSDGVIVARHPDFDRLVEMSEHLASNVHIYCD